MILRLLKSVFIKGIEETSFHILDLNQDTTNPSHKVALQINYQGTASCLKLNFLLLPKWSFLPQKTNISGIGWLDELSHVT